MRIVTVLALLITGTTALRAQPYEPVYPGYWPKTWSAMFALGDTWYRTGLHHLIECSTDQGATWENRTPDIPRFNILSVSASDQYAIGVLSPMQWAPPDWEDSTHTTVLLFRKGVLDPEYLRIPWFVPVTEGYLRKLVAFTAGDALFVAQAYSGIALLRSTDAGRTWAKLPLPDSLRNTVQIYARFHDRDRGILMANKLEGPPGLSIWVTHDAGERWTLVSGITMKIPPSNGMSMHVMPVVRWLSPDSVVLVDQNNRLLLSDDGGLHWNTMTENLGLSTIVDLTMNSGGNGYVVTDEGLVAGTSDFGVSYRTLRPAFRADDPRRGIPSILLQSAPSVLSVTDRVGTTQRTSDGGISWEEEALQDYFDGQQLKVISMDTVFLRMYELSTGSWLYVRTFNGGLTWEKCYDITGTKQLYRIEFVTPELWYGFRTPTVDDSSVVHQSRDAGVTWQPVYSGDVPDWLTTVYKGTPHHGEETFAFPSKTGIHMTTDGGRTWSVKGENLIPESQGGYLDISQYPDCYLSTVAGFHRSTDGGDTWTRILDRRGANLIVADAGRVYLEYSPVGPYAPRMLLRSMDGGSTWDSLKMAAGTYEFTYIDEHGRGSALGYNARAFLSTDDHWQTHTVQGERYGENPRGIRFLDRLNGWVSLSRSILRTTNGGVNWTKVTPSLPVSPRILSTWPQPAPQGGMMSTEIELTRPGPVRIEIYDLLGRRRAVVWDAEVTATRRIVQWSTAGLERGFYLLRMVTTAGAASGRVVVR
ncbi:MAG: hypothetical protein JXA28_14825 [Bacteroidetes bacterium]|nr:hypothetical protein [Bacteroidota bacterium]